MPSHRPPRHVVRQGPGSDSAANFLRKFDTEALGKQVRKLGKTQAWQGALELVGGLACVGLRLDMSMRISVLSVCAKSKQWDRAVASLTELQERRIELDEKAWGTTISGCCTKGGGAAALAIFADMTRALVEPDTRLLDIVAHAGRFAGEEVASVERALDIVSLLDSFGIDVSKATYHAVLKRLGTRSDKWAGALDILADMASRNVRPDITSYKLAHGACLASGAMASCAHLVVQMNLLGAMDEMLLRLPPGDLRFNRFSVVAGAMDSWPRALAELKAAVARNYAGVDAADYHATILALRMNGENEKATQVYNLSVKACGFPDMQKTPQMMDLHNQHADVARLAVLAKLWEVAAEQPSTYKLSVITGYGTHDARTNESEDAWRRMTSAEKYRIPKPGPVILPSVSAMLAQLDIGFTMPGPGCLQLSPADLSRFCSVVAPRASVDLLAGPASSTPATRATPAARGGDLLTPVAERTALVTEEAEKQVYRMLYEFDVGDDRMLRLKAGDEVIKLGEEEGGWCQGITASGERGLFPPTYAELVDSWNW